MSALRDIRNELKPLIALEPSVIASDTTNVGPIIDSADFDGGVMLTLALNGANPGTFTPLIEQSSQANFGGDVSDVADENLIGDVETGQEADAALSADGISNLGVVNQPKRYLRMSVVSSSTSGASDFAAFWHGKAEVSKISN